MDDQPQRMELWQKHYDSADSHAKRAANLGSPLPRFSKWLVGIIVAKLTFWSTFIVGLFMLPERFDILPFCFVLGGVSGVGACLISWFREKNHYSIYNSEFTSEINRLIDGQRSRL